MKPNESGKFKLKNKVSLSQFGSSLSELPESDLCFQDGDSVYQFEYEEPQEESKYEITPGTYMISDSSGGLKLEKMLLKDRVLLDSVNNTNKIIAEARTFFSKLHVYEKLNRPKKRGVLLYSKPGMGKTSAIERVSKDLITEDPGTVILVWPTSEIEPDQIVRFLTVDSTYNEKCTRMILIMEDIGGGEREGHRSHSAVSSGLLNLLDGVGIVFRLPTFIIATTNHPENLLQSLADRPGRFDLMLQLKAPSHDEKIELMKFISKRDLNDEEKLCLGRSGTEEFSIAHLEEIAVRAELHDKTYSQVVDELIEHTIKFKKDFSDDTRDIGFGLNL